MNETFYFTQHNFASGKKEYNILIDPTALPMRTRRIMQILFTGSYQDCFRFWEARLAMARTVKP